MKLTADVEIARSAEEVFSYLSNFENNPAWQAGMVAARYTTEPPQRVGSTYEQEARFLGRPVITSFEITALEPGRSVSIESVVSTFPISVTRSVEPLGEGRCRVRAEIGGGPGFPLSLFGPLLGWMAQRSVTRDYEKLKELMET